MTKKQAGALGGTKTRDRYGKDYLRELGSRGGYATWLKYTLVPYGISQFAMVDRITGQVKAIRSA